MISGGGGAVEENVPEQSIYFFLVWKQFFYFTINEKNKFFFSFIRKDETIFFSAYYGKTTFHAASFHNNMCNSVGSEPNVGLQQVSGLISDSGSILVIN